MHLLIKLSLAVSVALVCTIPALAQVNTVNSVVTGNRPATFEGDPYAGAAILTTAGDFSAKPEVAGSNFAIVSPSSNCLFTAYGKQAWLWNITNGVCTAPIPQGSNVTFASFSPSGNIIVVASSSNAKIWCRPVIFLVK